MIDEAAYGERQIRSYDFRIPDRFSKEELRSIQLLHENFARMASSSLSAFLRSVVEVELMSVQEEIFEDFADSLTPPHVLGLASADPLDGTLLVHVDPAIIFPIIDRILGGPGQPLMELRALTDIELTMTERVLSNILGVLAEAWSSVVDMEPQINSLEANPRFSQPVAPNEVLVKMLFRLQLSNHEGALNICFPYVMLEPILPKISAHEWFSRRIEEDEEKDRQFTDQLEERVKNVAVPLVVELGKTKITLAELLRLEPGDVLTLQQKIDDPLPVFVREKETFLAVPGKVGKHLACKIVADLFEEGV